MLVKILAVAALAAALVLALAGPVVAAPAAVTVSVDVAARDASSVTLRWRLDLADGWYVYGPFRNDAGFPPSVQLDLPDGWRAGPLRWPAPERHLLTGGILDHVYHHRLEMVQTLRRDPSAAAAVRATARVQWLACRTSCVPGDTTLSVDTAAPLSGDLAAALAAVPGPLPDGAATARRRDSAVEIVAPGARALTVIPAEDAPLLLDLAGDGHVPGDRLVLRFLPGAAAPPPFQALLIIDHESGATLGYLTL